MRSRSCSRGSSSRALVTIDAIGCRSDIAQAIRDKGADYLPALKDNWPTLAREVRLFFEREPAAAGVPSRWSGK